MKHLAIIFDLDGTLLDTLADLANSMNSVVASMGYPTHPTKQYKAFVGNGVRTLAARALGDAASDAFVLDLCVARMREEYTKQCLATTKPYSGINELLQTLAVNGILLNVLSNKPDAMTKYLVTMLFSEIPFSCIVGAREGVPHKPDPTAAIEMLQTLKLSPSQCLYVGDSGVDMQTAAAAGLTSVGVEWGFRTKAELVDNGATYCISEPKELLGIVGL